MLCTEDLVRDCVLVQLRVREAVLDAVLDGGAPGCEAVLDAVLEGGAPGCDAVLAGCEARLGARAGVRPSLRATDEA